MPNTLTLLPTRLGYGERPLRREPGNVPGSTDIYLSTPEERAETVRASIDAGITYFHAEYEREAQSLGASLKALGVRDRVTVSTTDGDVLDRCPDTEDGAAAAIRGAIARKRELLGIDTLDVFCLYDIRPDVHTPARLAGARQALAEAQSAGHIRHIGVTCDRSYDTLADLLERDLLTPEIVLARCNYFDQSALTHLFPCCHSKGITTVATKPFAWLGGVPFVRFPNTWRYRNLTKNFYGFTAAQAHLYWLLSHPQIDGVLVSMQTPAQVSENLGATQIAKTPAGLESLFESFVEAITKTKEGWRGLLQDEMWEYRMAAETYLQRKKRL